MTIKQHIRMTASEIAMGRYMRAPDHAAATAAQSEFDAAFSTEALKDVVEDSPATAAPAADPPAADPPAADPPAADPPAAEPPAADPPAADPPAADPPAADPPAADPPVADPPAAAEADDILNRLAEAVAKQPKVDVPAPAPAAVEAPAAETPPIFNEAEVAALAKFKEDWPTEHEAVSLMQRELGVSLVRHVFDQMSPVVREIRDTVQKLALSAHQSELHDVLGEYPSDDEINGIKVWVKTQPAYLQGPMNDVIEKGTAEEIGDLVGRYREATGAKPAEVPAPEPKPQRGETELSGAAKQAAEAMAPVGSKRSAVQSPDDMSDFDAGWEKWVDMKV